jgi:hypothetical protein
MSNKTSVKYYNFMMALYNAKEFEAKEMIAEHRVSTRIMRLLREARYIKRVGNVTVWIGEAPTQAIAMAMTKQCTKESRIHNVNRKAGISQLTIAPIRKAPVSTPQAIVHEAEYDNSNSKVLLILAVGAVIGFMIATLIWK